MGGASAPNQVLRLRRRELFGRDRDVASKFRESDEGPGSVVPRRQRVRRALVETEARRSFNLLNDEIPAEIGAGAAELLGRHIEAEIRRVDSGRAAEKRKQLIRPGFPKRA